MFTCNTYPVPGWFSCTWTCDVQGCTSAAGGRRRRDRDPGEKTRSHSWNPSDRPYLAGMSVV